MDERQFTIVVIGASMGGLNALKTVLGAIPGDYPLPIAIVLHRDIRSEDMLPDFFKKYSDLKVVKVEDKMPFEPGTVYFAPPDYHLLVDDGHFALSVDGEDSFARPSINALFESAADACGDGVIGVILTGTGSDGARGLESIKSQGGVAIVQDPASAESSGMPEAALAAVTPDAVLPLEEIGPHLARLATEE